MAWFGLMTLFRQVAQEHTQNKGDLDISNAADWRKGPFAGMAMGFVY